MSFVFDLTKAFLIGGLLCMIGQILTDRTALTPGRVLVLFVVCGVVLGALGLYEPLANWAGEGAAIPLTGFGYHLAKETAAAVDQSGLWGAIEAPFSAAGVGTLAAILSALAVSLFARSKDK